MLIYFFVGIPFLKFFLFPILIILIKSNYVFQDIDQIFIYQFASTLTFYLLTFILIPLVFYKKKKGYISEFYKYISIIIGIYLIVNCIYFLTSTNLGGNLTNYENHVMYTNKISIFVINNFEYFGIIFGSICSLIGFVPVKKLINKNDWLVSGRFIVNKTFYHF